MSLKKIKDEKDSQTEIIKNQEELLKTVIKENALLREQILNLTKRSMKVAEPSENEKDTDKEIKKTYATVAKLNNVVIKDMNPKYKPVTNYELAQAFKKTPTTPQDFHVLCHFEGFRRQRPTIIKKILWEMGVKIQCIKDIDFVGGSILGILTLNTYKTELCEKIEMAKKSARFAKIAQNVCHTSLNLLSNSNFKKKINDSPAVAAEKFKERMTSKLNRLRKGEEVAPSLHCTANFIKKVIEHMDQNYQPRLPSQITVEDFIPNYIEMDCEGNVDAENSNEKIGNEIGNIDQIC